MAYGPPVRSGPRSTTVIHSIESSNCPFKATTAKTAVKPLLTKRRLESYFDEETSAPLLDLNLALAASESVEIPAAASLSVQPQVELN